MDTFLIFTGGVLLLVSAVLFAMRRRAFAAAGLALGVVFTLFSVSIRTEAYSMPTSDIDENHEWTLIRAAARAAVREATSHFTPQEACATKREKAERKRIEAQGIAGFRKIIIIGAGDDGLSLILNTE